jgi:hypothetical protein
MKVSRRLVILLVVVVALILMGGEGAGAWSMDPTFSAGSCALHVAGRDYTFGASCGGGRYQCWSPRFLKAHGDWPPGRRVPILSLHGVFAVYVQSAPSGASPTIVFVQRGGCYLPYALSGGP